MKWQVERVETRDTIRFRLTHTDRTVVETMMIKRSEVTKWTRAEAELCQIADDLNSLARPLVNPAATPSGSKPSKSRAKPSASFARRAIKRFQRLFRN